MLPQLYGLGTLLLIISGLSAYGIYLSAAALREGGQIATLTKASQVFVGGSSSILGFVLLKLIAKMTELTTLYIGEKKRFTSQRGKIRLSNSRAQLVQAMQDYGMRASVTSAQSSPTRGQSARGSRHDAELQPQQELKSE